MRETSEHVSMRHRPIGLSTDKMRGCGTFQLPDSWTRVWAVTVGGGFVKKAILLEIVLPNLPGFGASDSQVGSAATWAIVCSDSVPKTPAQTLRRECLVQGLVDLTILSRQRRLFVFLALKR